MESGFLLDVVIGEGAAIFKLFTSEDQALLVGRDSFLVLDLGLHVVDGVGRLHLQGDSLTSEGLDDWGLLLVRRQTQREMCCQNLQICIPPRRRRTK